MKSWRRSPLALLGLLLCSTLAGACADEIPGPPASLSITPTSGPEGVRTTVVVRGEFEAVRLEVDYPDPSVGAGLELYLGDTALEEVRLVGEGAVEAVVPETVPAGLHPLRVIDGRGQEGRLEDAFRVLGAADRIDHFEIDPIPDVFTDTPFDVVVRAVDASGALLTDFTGGAAVVDRTGTLSPTTLSPFVGGVWSGSLTIVDPIADDTLTVTAGSASTESNHFAVTCPGSCTCIPFLADTDVDGFGDDARRRWACAAPAGYVEEGGDCDDAVREIHPGAPEVAADGIDQDCDGVDACYHDGDGDTYGGLVPLPDDDLDCTNSGPAVVTIGGDCLDSDDTVHPGAAELVADGVDQDCDGRERCYQDLDGDGFGTTVEVDDTDTDCSNASAGEADNPDDCDDQVATCTTSCTTNTDGDVPAVSDCMELFCGSDPLDPASSCVIADGATTSLEDAIATANSTPGYEHILVDYAALVAGPLVISSADGSCLDLRTIGGRRITVTGGSPGVQIDDDGCHLEGLDIVDATVGVLISGDGSTLRDLRVSSGATGFHVEGSFSTLSGVQASGFSDEGVKLTGAGNRVIDSILHGCLGPPSGGRAGVVIDFDGGGVKPDGNVIADNLIVNNACAAIQLRESPDATVIDHNTIAFNTSGVTFLSAGVGASNLCMRGNLITDNTGAALEFNKLATFDTSAACVGPLPVGPVWGNGQVANALGACSGSVCAACACLPAGSFWSHDLAPAYLETTDPTAANAFCPGEVGLVDQGVDLGYDLNGPQDGLHAGAAPDLGARETGAEGCPSPPGP
ncbi:MAG: MopE-related protein [Deltaproteobacteria bacterium]|nr:MopE-related protein [Deltaproteobacteria bacterium]